MHEIMSEGEIVLRVTREETKSAASLGASSSQNSGASLSYPSSNGRHSSTSFKYPPTIDETPAKRVIAEDGASVVGDTAWAEPTDLIDEWLAQFGAQFDPYRVLDASEDERLSEYLVAHEVFESIWRDAPSLVYAAAGGGKSALRARLARACRVGENGRRVFPIVYMMPETVVISPDDELFTAHLAAILRSAAFELLLRLAYRPHEFLRLGVEEQTNVRALLDAELAGSVTHHLDGIGSDSELEGLAAGYDITAKWPNTPSFEKFQEFRQVLLKTESAPDIYAGSDRFARWIDVLKNTLGFEAVYLLIDGVDGFPETIHSPDRSVTLLEPLLRRIETWQKQGVFLKFFLPSELRRAIARSYHILTKEVTSITVEWSEELLVLMLRRRLEVALGMAPASLDMLASPGLRDVERRIVRSARPLPREVLALTEFVLLAHIERVGPVGKLDLNDIEQGRDQYQHAIPPELRMLA